MVEKDLAEQGGGLGAGLAHAGGVEVVDFGFEEVVEEGEEDLMEDS